MKKMYPKKPVTEKEMALFASFVQTRWRAVAAQWLFNGLDLLQTACETGEDARKFRTKLRAMTDDERIGFVQRHVIGTENINTYLDAGDDLALIARLTQARMRDRQFTIVESPVGKYLVPVSQATGRPSWSFFKAHLSDGFRNLWECVKALPALFRRNAKVKAKDD